jgi:hypothetical protein
MKFWISVSVSEFFIEISWDDILGRGGFQSKADVTYILLDALDESPRGNKREGVLDAVQTIRQWGLPYCLSKGAK